MIQLPFNPRRQRQKIQTEDCISNLVIRKIKELVNESIKNLNGGLMPREKDLKKLLRVEIHPDGRVFHFKGQPMLFIAPHKFGKSDNGEWQLQIPHKRLYEKEPEPPLGATN